MSNAKDNSVFTWQHDFESVFYMSNKADFVLLEDFVLFEARDSRIRSLFAHLIFSLKFWFSNLISTSSVLSPL